ncbi:MAG: recombinase family protein [Lachnospiraceae bacterium]|nr:recombinase family protein [Lachnospiraceae bacterium]
MMEKYCAYLRKSRTDRDAELRGEEETLARHKRILIELSEKLQKPITKFYSEVVSGDTISDRPVMQNLLADVETGMWDGVFVIEVERLARGNTRDQGLVADAFKYSDTVIITPTKTYDPNNEFDEEYFEFGLFMSRREYKTITRRLQRGRIASVKEGNYVGGAAPYGYKRVRLTKGYSLEIVPEQAEVVKQIFNWYCYGFQQPDGSMQRLGTDSIAVKLDSLGIKPTVNERWSRATIGDMLKNITYTGRVFFGQYKEIKTSENGRIVKKRVYDPNHLVAPGKHQAIISDELFSLTAQIRKERRKKTVPSTAILQNPLSGIVYCQKCGALMTRLAPNNRNKYSTLKCPNRYCDNISSPLYLVEEELLKFLDAWVKSYEFDLRRHLKERPVENEIRNRRDLLAKVEKDITITNNQLQKTYSLLEQEIYTLDVFKERQQTLKTELSSLNASRDMILKEIKDLETADEARSSFLPKLKNLLDTYYSSTIEAQNQMLTEVITKVTYEKNERNKKGQLDNANFTIHVYPKVPE